MKKPVIVLLTGPPGSGKGTFLKNLFCEISFSSIGVGDKFNKLPPSNLTKRAIKKTVKQGKLVPDFIANSIVSGFLFNELELGIHQKFLFIDGYPRNVSQAKYFVDMMKNFYHLSLYQVLVFRIIADFSVTIDRIENRKEDRVDDKNKECLIERNRSYIECTVPAIEYVRQDFPYYLEVHNGQGIPIDHSAKEFLKFIAKPPI